MTPSYISLPTHCECSTHMFLFKLSGLFIIFLNLIIIKQFIPTDSSLSFTAHITHISLSAHLYLHNINHLGPSLIPNSTTILIVRHSSSCLSKPFPALLLHICLIFVHSSPAALLSMPEFTSPSRLLASENPPVQN